MELTYGKKPEEKVVTTDYLVTYNAMVVPSATLNVEYHPETNQITVWSEQLIKSLYIYC